MGKKFRMISLGKYTGAGNVTPTLGGSEEGPIPWFLHLLLATHVPYVNLFFIVQSISGRLNLFFIRDILTSSIVMAKKVVWF